MLQAAVQEAGDEHREHCPGCQQELLLVAKKDWGAACRGQLGQPAQSKQQARILQAFSQPPQPAVIMRPMPAAMLEARPLRPLPPPAASSLFHPGSTHDQAAKQSSFSCMPYPELVRPEAAHRVRPSPPSVQPPVLQPFQPCQPPLAPQPFQPCQPPPRFVATAATTPPAAAPAATVAAITAATVAATTATTSPVAATAAAPTAAPQPPPLQQSERRPQQPRRTQPAAPAGITAAPSTPQPAQAAPKPTEQNPKRKKKWSKTQTLANIGSGLRIVSCLAGLVTDGYTDYNNGMFS